MTEHGQREILPCPEGWFKEGVVEEKYLLPSQTAEDVNACFSLGVFTPSHSAERAPLLSTAHSSSFLANNNTTSASRSPASSSLWSSAERAASPRNEQDSKMISRLARDPDYSRSEVATETSSDIHSPRFLPDMDQLFERTRQGTGHSHSHSHSHSQYYYNTFQTPEFLEAPQSAIEQNLTQDDNPGLPSTMLSATRDEHVTSILEPDDSPDGVDGHENATVTTTNEAGNGSSPTSSHAASEAPSSVPYATLIYRALSSVPGQKMVLKDIYEWFEENTDKARAGSEKGWQNSIRHNLSMNKGFRKVEQEPPSDDRKRGFVWVLDESAICAGGVESTTRYRKTSGRKNCHVTFSNGLHLPEEDSTKPAPMRSLTRKRGGRVLKSSPSPSLRPLSKADPEANSRRCRRGPRAGKQQQQFRQDAATAFEDSMDNETHTGHRAGRDHERQSSQQPREDEKLELEEHDEREFDALSDEISNQTATPPSTEGSAFTTPSPPSSYSSSYNFASIVGCATGLDDLDRYPLFVELPAHILHHTTHVFADWEPCRPGHHTSDCERYLCRV